MIFLKILALLYISCVFSMIAVCLILNFCKKHNLSDLISYLIGALIGLSVGLSFLYLIS